MEKELKGLGRFIKPFSFSELFDLDQFYIDPRKDFEPEFVEDDLKLYERLNEVENRVDALRRRSIDNSIFYQKETFTLNNEFDNYRFRFNNNYKYCHGFVILTNLSSKSMIAGLKHEGNFVFDKVPCYLLDRGALSFYDNIIPLNIDAAGKFYEFFFDKNGISISSIDVLFILSNNKLDNPKRNFGYTEISITGSTTHNGYLDIDYSKKKIKSISIVGTPTQMSSVEVDIYDDNIYYLDSLNSLEIRGSYMNQCNFNERLLKIDIPVGYIKYRAVESGGTSGTLFIIYEYE